ncbi:MAG: rhamnulokinase family protein [Actinomycetota bacterium]
MNGAVAAVDLGATSGRVMLGYVGHNELNLRPVARFPNGPVATSDGLHWNVTELYRHVLSGIEAAIREETNVQSIGVDSWAVDYALLSGDRMLAEPFHYRDERTLPAVAVVHESVSAADLYRANGLQHLSFNTLFQLTADRLSGDLDHADGMLLIPDLLGFWLTGVRGSELTNASTTGLLSVTTRTWDDAVLKRLSLPRSIFPDLIEPGTPLGAARAFAGVQVTTVGSHDTASAVVAVPSTRDDFAYISCGTWGLVGVELENPVLTEASRLANFTNEGGVDGRVRFLHNVMGLWLLSESVRTWEEEGDTIDLPSLIDAASVATAEPFDAEDPRFLGPGDMPARIAGWYSERGLPAPQSRAEFVRAIIESLAVAFAQAVETASALSGRRVSVIHIVGGGSQNELLCQFTADRSGLPVLAGPVEATAIGNVLVQARAQGLVTGSLESLRALVASAFSPKVYPPRR